MCRDVVCCILVLTLKSCLKYSTIKKSSEKKSSDRSSPQRQMAPVSRIIVWWGKIHTILLTCVDVLIDTDLIAGQLGYWLSDWKSHYALAHSVPFELLKVRWISLLITESSGMPPRCTQSYEESRVLRVSMLDIYLLAALVTLIVKRAMGWKWSGLGEVLRSVRE